MIMNIKHNGSYERINQNWKEKIDDKIRKGKERKGKKRKGKKRKQGKNVKLYN